ncbi:thymidylate kinase isoform X2 [Thrips palmi]|nr:thymidylate kinase isoform X2 [Thrips palmi]XP_034238458.1 thymidylate kinase isoform X2 [Thrips palmi]XP_034238459.1 thymidylate kinase isoform X2 [Thrips palmi]
MVRRGTFIVFEGCDRGGKTTQCKKLVEALNKKNIPAEYMNFPDRTTAVGKIINDYLKKNIELPDHAVHLLFSANRWELEPVIRKKLHSGVSLVVDRYSYSGVAFSAAKENMDLQWCWNQEEGLPAPDAVFILNLSESASLQRGGFGEERYELTDFQAKVRSNYKLLKDPKIWKDIDADRDVESVHNEILKLFEEVHSQAVSQPIKTLKNLTISHQNGYFANDLTSNGSIPNGSICNGSIPNGAICNGR